MADRDGVVWSSVVGIADRARVPLEDTRAALLLLSSADPDSRSENDEGRRIEKVERGWRIINLSTLKERARKEAEKERKRRWWAKNHPDCNNSTDASSNESSFEQTSGHSTPLAETSAVKQSIAKHSKVDLSTRDKREPSDFVLSAPTPKTIDSKSKRTAPPDAFEPNDTTLAWAKRHGEHWRPHWQRCSDWARSNGKLKIDWQATLRNWISSNVGMYPLPKAPTEKYVRPVDPNQPPFAPGPVHAFTTEEDRQAERIRRGLLDP